MTLMELLRMVLGHPAPKPLPPAFQRQQKAHEATLERVDNLGRKFRSADRAALQRRRIHQ